MFSKPFSFCLGPLFFLIYSNELPICLQSSEATIYADYTTVPYSSKSIGEMNEMLSSDLHCLDEWLYGNKLAINVTKTQAMTVAVST